MRSGGLHAEPPPPASIFRFFMRLSFPMRFRGLPTHGPPPHTVSRFPHTTTRLTHFSIRFPRIHHTIHKLQRIRLQIRRDQRPAPQTPNQSCPTDTLNLRYSPANQAPAKSSKSHMPATGGGAGTTGAHIHGHARTFTAMFTPAQMCAYLHGHGIRARLRRDQRPALANQAPTQLTQTPTSNDWGAWVWHRLAMRRRRRRQRRRQRRRRQGRGRCVCVIGPKGPIVVRPEGRTA